MTDLQMDTTKDAALRLCAEVVEERDALLKLVRRFANEDPTKNWWVLVADARVLLARLDGRTE